MNNLLKTFIKKPGNKEAVIWLGALLFFAFYKPDSHQHFTLCVFNWVGFESCLGCGIGRSIALFLKGDILGSWNMHYFGIPATLILTHRLANIIYQNYFKQLKTRIQ